MSPLLSYPDSRGWAGLRPRGVAARRSRPAPLRVSGRAASRRPGAAARGAASRGGAHRPAGTTVPRRRDERARRPPAAPLGAHAVYRGQAIITTTNRHYFTDADSPRRPSSSFRSTARWPPVRQRRRRKHGSASASGDWMPCDEFGQEGRAARVREGASAPPRVGAGRPSTPPRRHHRPVARQARRRGRSARLRGVGTRRGRPCDCGYAAQGFPSRAAHPGAPPPSGPTS